MYASGHPVNAWVNAGEVADGSGNVQLRQSRIITVRYPRQCFDTPDIQAVHLEECTIEVVSCIWKLIACHRQGDKGDCPERIIYVTTQGLKWLQARQNERIRAQAQCQARHSRAEAHKQARKAEQRMTEQLQRDNHVLRLQALHAAALGHAHEAQVCQQHPPLSMACTMSAAIYLAHRGCRVLQSI